MSLQGAFRALADPTRREILVLLTNRDMTVSEVCSRFEITRTAVKKHLTILEEGGLVTAWPQGRDRINRLSPEPLQAVSDWVGFFSQFWDGRLDALRDAIRNEPNRKKQMNDKIVKTAYFDVPPETVWTFLTDKDKLGIWFHPAKANLVGGEAFECYRTADDGAKIRQIWGKVLVAEAPTRLVHTFEIAPFNGKETRVEWELEAVRGGTRLTLTHSGIADAAGETSLPLVMALDSGWDEHIRSLRNQAKGGGQ